MMPDTKNITRATAGGLAGFLVLLAAEGVLLLAFLASFNMLDLGSSRVTSLTLLLLMVVPLLLIIAAALPAMSLGATKKISVLAAVAASVCSILLYLIPLADSRGTFDRNETLSFVTLVGVAVLLAVSQPSQGRQRRVGVLLGVWALFMILGVIVASFSQIGAGLTVLLAWLVLPAVAARLQTTSYAVPSQM